MSQKAGWNEHRKAHARILGTQVAAECSKKGFQAVYADSPEEALEKVLSLIPQGTAVGISGSVSVREIGAVEALEKRGNPVVQHWDPSLKTTEEKKSPTSGRDFLYGTPYGYQCHNPGWHAGEYRRHGKSHRRPCPGDPGRSSSWWGSTRSARILKPPSGGYGMWLPLPTPCDSV